MIESQSELNKAGSHCEEHIEFSWSYKNYWQESESKEKEKHSYNEKDTSYIIVRSRLNGRSHLVLNFVSLIKESFFCGTD